MSTASENAEIIRRGYKAFNTADMDTLTELFTEGVTWSTPGSSPIAGDAKGRDAVFARFGQYATMTDGTFQAHLKGLFTGADDFVVGLHHNTGERNGRQLDVECCIVFELEEGRLVAARECFADLDAWDAFWA